jgi:hypothetical protein
MPHCLDNRLTDGGKVVSPTHPPHFTPQKHYYFNVYKFHFFLKDSHVMLIPFYAEIIISKKGHTLE